MSAGIYLKNSNGNTVLDNELPALVASNKFTITGTINSFHGKYEFLRPTGGYLDMVFCQLDVGDELYAHETSTGLSYLVSNRSSLTCMFGVNPATVSPSGHGAVLRDDTGKNTWVASERILSAKSAGYITSVYWARTSKLNSGQSNFFTVTPNTGFVQQLPYNPSVLVALGIKRETSTTLQIVGLAIGRGPGVHAPPMQISWIGVLA